MKQDDLLIEDMLKKAIEIIKEKKGENIVSMKFSPIVSSICDYFLICDVSNEKQAQAICDALQREMRTENKIRPSHIEGYESSRWILIDYWDIIIHIFLTESRDFYGLEKLWADAKIEKY